MKTVCEVLGVSRSNLAVKSKRDAEWGDKRKTLAREEMPLVAELQELVADLPTDGYRRPGPSRAETGTHRGSLGLMQNRFIGSCIPTTCRSSAALDIPNPGAGTMAGSR